MTNFTKLKEHNLHFWGYNLRSKLNFHALEGNKSMEQKIEFICESCKEREMISESSVLLS